MPNKNKKKGTKKKKTVKVVVPVLKKKKKKKNQSSGLTVVRRSSVPVAKGVTVRQKGANINGGKWFRVKHKELIVSIIVSTTAWNTYRYQAQPGVGTTFPWLSQLADSFKEYRFRKLRFYYEPNCSTAREGAIILIPLYNPSDVTPGSASQALDCKNAISFPVWQRGSSSFSGQKFMKNLFVRTMDAPDSESLKFYDSGAMVLGLDGVSIGANVGKFMVEYEIDFFVPYKTSGMSSGYGFSAGNLNNVFVDNVFSFMNYNIDANGRFLKWEPPSGLNFIDLGNSTISPEYNGGGVANNIRFSEPGYYACSLAVQTIGTGGYPYISGVVATGCSVTVYASKTTAALVAAAGEVVVTSLLVEAVIPFATAHLVWIASDEVKNPEFSVFTVNNAVFETTENSVFGTTPVLYSKEAARDLARFKRSNILSKKNVQVVDAEVISEFKRTRKIPKLGESDVLKRYKALKAEMDLLSEAVLESKEDSEEDMPLGPGPREEVKQSREPLVAPVVKSASSGIGSYVGAVLGRKPGDK